MKKKIEDDIGNYGLIYSDEDMQQVSKILSPDSFRTGQAEEKYRKDLSTGAKWSQGKLILGILSLLSAAFIITRFYYVQGSNHLLLNNSGIEGASLLAATCYIITGIIAVAARKTKKRFPWILCTLLLFFSCFGIASTGVINNFQIIWGLFSLILGAFYLLSAARRPAGIFISILFTCLIAAFCLQLLNILPKVLLYF
ncbi:MAG: hypothetical protein Q4F31_10145 [Eubacteriales bacterium]|nr:hypothetical protein [Eubacteriales bacterium]